MVSTALVVDASAIVDLLLANRASPAIAVELASHEVKAPAHLDLEALSALGRLQRAGALEAAEVQARLRLLAELPIIRVPLEGLVVGAWQRRQALRLADAVYVELAEQLGCRLLTTDQRLVRGALVAYSGE